MRNQQAEFDRISHRMKPLILIASLLLAGTAFAAPPPIHSYPLSHNGTAASYDETLAVTCIQGIVNRPKPELYVLSKIKTRPQYWLDIMRSNGRWLEGRPVEPIADLDTLVRHPGDRVKGVVIWDEVVPATVNIATTLAGVLDAIAISPQMAHTHLPKWKLPVLKDLRGQFKSKNEAYRWCLREYLAKGACTSRIACLFEDSFGVRGGGELRYVVTRDLAVKHRAFVFDLSPWGDETPADDPTQKPGTDLETLKSVFAELVQQAAGKHLTEINGFFNFAKYSNVPGHASKHNPVPTEWEYVWLMSPHNCYQNTITADCYNQSFHSHAPRQPLVQQR
ncbi:MAG: GxGYxYP domain-containing protein, partial [Thermoguttaceae bacterium]